VGPVSTELILAILWSIPGFLLAIVCHEAAHAWAANLLGDPTGRMLGRLSLNPSKHVDPWGTVLLPLMLIVFSQGSMMFGYARPVPVTIGNFKHPRRDSALVSLAGPAANVLLAIMFILAAWGGQALGLLGNLGVRRVLEAGVNINLILAAFNLLPIPPLDGSELVAALLPGPLAYRYQRLAPYGFMILMGLYFFGWLQKFMEPIFFLFRLLMIPLGNPF
jgi:Zn-dependent protease